VSRSPEGNDGRLNTEVIVRGIVVPGYSYVNLDQASLLEAGEERARSNGGGREGAAAGAKRGKRHPVSAYEYLHGVIISPSPSPFPIPALPLSSSPAAAPYASFSILARRKAGFPPASFPRVIPPLLVIPAIVLSPGDFATARRAATPPPSSPSPPSPCLVTPTPPIARAPSRARAGRSAGPRDSHFAIFAVLSTPPARLLRARRSRPRILIPRSRDIPSRFLPSVRLESLVRLPIRRARVFGELKRGCPTTPLPTTPTPPLLSSSSPPPRSRQ